MLEPVTDALWTAVHPFSQPGGVVIPSRMTVVRLPDGALWVHSPIPGSPTLFAAVDALGPVRHLVAPNLMHHLGLAAWVERYPDATVHAPARLAEKLPHQQVDAALSLSPPEAWGGVFDVAFIAGAPDLDEHVFHHRPTGTLIETDLLFHMIDRVNLPTAAVLKLMGTHGRLARSRAWWWFSKDPAAVRESVARVRAWQARRLVPCHGAALDGDISAQLDAALAGF